MTLRPEDKRLVAELVAASKPKQRPYNSLRLRRCCLCGEPSRGAYCFAHSWAAGER